MSELPSSKNSRGIIHILPLLIIGLLVFGAAAISSGKVKLRDLKQNVLSESESGGSSGSSGSDSSDDNQGKDEAEVENEVENENEDEVENEEELEVESGTEAAKVKIKVRRVENRFVFRTREVEAETNFPLSVNPQTNELVVTTPAGEKIVAILPDQAVANMLANNVFDRQQKVNIVFENGTVIYRISGNKDEKLLGIFKVVVPTTAVVSADTGQLVTQEQTFLFKFLDLLSI